MTLVKSQAASGARAKLKPCKPKASPVGKKVVAGSSKTMQRAAPPTAAAAPARAVPAPPAAPAAPSAASPAQQLPHAPVPAVHKVPHAIVPRGSGGITPGAAMSSQAFGAPSAAAQQQQQPAGGSSAGVRGGGSAPRSKSLQEGVKRKVPAAAAAKRTAAPAKRSRKRSAASDSEGDQENEDDEAEEPVRQQRLIDYCSNYRQPKAALPAGQKRQKVKPEERAAAKAAAAAAKKSKADQVVLDRQRARAPPKPVVTTAVKVRIVNGKMQVDQSSVELGGRRPEVTEELEEVFEDAEPTATACSFKDRAPSERWTLEETREFFRCLQMCGADFSMLEEVLQSARTRKQIMNKYKREEKKSPELINLALKARTPLDISDFLKRVAAANGTDAAGTAAAGTADAAADAASDDEADMADLMAVGDVIGHHGDADAMEEVHE